MASALVIGNSAIAQQIRFAPECKKIKEIGESVKQLKARRDKIAIGDKAHWCPLNKKQIDYIIMRR